jgi:hypothetical protein
VTSVSPAGPEAHIGAAGHARLTGIARPAGRLGLAAFFVIALVALMLEVANDTWTPETVLQVGAYAAFAVVGALLLEQAGHPIGAICLAVGLGGAINGFGQEYVDFADLHAGVPGVEAVMLVSMLVGFPGAALAFTFLPLLFPNGRLPSPRWRPVAWIAIADIALLILAIGFTPTGLFSTRPNPIVLVPAGVPSDAVLAGASVFTALSGTLCAGALLWRYRRADAVTCQQLKWVAGAVALFAIGLVVSILVPPIDTFALLLPVIPLAVGIAVLRYRLYDIDVLIGRALVYVPLTAILAGLYAASVALFQRLFTAITGQTSDAAIVLTTLILAAVFTPARKALENAVERRFKPSLASPEAATAPHLVALDDPELEERMSAVARMAVREALADRDRIAGGKRRSSAGGD